MIFSPKVPLQPSVRSHLVPCVATGMALLAGPAHAGKVDRVDFTESSYLNEMVQPPIGPPYPDPGPVIRVKSNDGESYHYNDTTGLTFGMWTQLVCSSGSMDSSVKVTIGNHTQTLMDGWSWSLLPYNEPYAANHIVQVPYIAPTIAQNPVAACNNQLSQWENVGVPRWEAMQKGFAIPLDAAYSATLQVSCGKHIVDTKTVSETMKGWIHCMPSALAQAPPEAPPPPEPASTDMQIAFAVSAAAVMLPQSIKTAPCPTQLLAQAQITTTGPGMVKYRWVHNDAEGPVATVHFHQGGTAKLESQLTVGQSGQGGLAVTPGGQRGGGGFGLAQATVDNQVQGFVRVRMVETPGVQMSEAAHYTVTCDDTAGPDGMAVTPLPPTPQIPLGPQQIGTPASPPEPAGTRDPRRGGRDTTPRATPPQPVTAPARPTPAQPATAPPRATAPQPATAPTRAVPAPPAPDAECVKRCEAAGRVEPDDEAIKRCLAACAAPRGRQP